MHKTEETGGRKGDRERKKQIQTVLDCAISVYVCECECKCER